MPNPLLLIEFLYVTSLVLIFNIPYILYISDCFSLLKISIISRTRQIDP